MKQEFNVIKKRAFKFDAVIDIEIVENKLRVCFDGEFGMCYFLLKEGKEFMFYRFSDNKLEILTDNWDATQENLENLMYLQFACDTLGIQFKQV